MDQQVPQRFLVILALLVLLLGGHFILKNTGFYSGGAQLLKLPFVLFTGDTSSTGCFEYAALETGAGTNGTNALKLMGDQWHSPLIKILCGNAGRRDLSTYSNLSFLIRSDSPNPDPLEVWVYTFAGPNGQATSNRVALSNYIQNGTITSAWKHVTIPIVALQTSSWNLSSAEALQFSVSPSNSRYFVDNITFNPAPVLINAQVEQPAAGSTFTIPEGLATYPSLNYWGSVISSANNIVKVEFFDKGIKVADGSLVRADNTNVYTYSAQVSNIPPGGHSLTIKVTNAEGLAVTSEAISYTIHSRRAETSGTTFTQAQPTPTPTPTATPQNINIVTLLGGQVLTKSQAGTCLTNLITPTGSNSGECVRTLQSQPVGTYTLQWVSGYPSGADTTKSPNISPSAIQSISSGPLTFYVEFGREVVVPVPNPTATFTASPENLTSGNNTNLTWSAQNASSCTASSSPPITGWNGSVSLSGQFITPGLTQNTTFYLSCRNSANVTVNRSVAVAVTGSTPFNILPVDLSKQLKIWTGESTSEQSVAVNFGAVVSGGANTGTYAFSARPDAWNAARINLANVSSYRSSISSYDFIQFSIKAVPTSGSLPATVKGIFSIYAWPHTSNQLAIENYVADGSALGSTYKIIRIPTSALRVNGGFDLSSIEFLQFSLPSGTSGYTFLVDDVYAIKVTPNDVAKTQVISNTTIRLTAKDRYDMAAVTNATNYSLSSPADTNYQTAKTPIEIGRQTSVVQFEGSYGGSYGLTNAPVIEPNIYLVFNPPLKEGVAYNLTVKTITDKFGNNFAAPKVIPFTYSDNIVTGSVQANQVGYLPVSPKFAYIGNYLGDADHLTGTPTSCKVMNATTGALVGTYNVVHRALDTQLSGNNVYNCDFSSLTTLGTYYVVVPGFGKTYDFKIAANIYNDIFRKLSNFYYNQRANVPVVYGQWSRPAGTLATDQAARLHSVNYTNSVHNPLPNNQTDYPSGSTLDMTGGWYDAGDYGKYVLPASGPINDLLFAYELYPQKFADGQADIPENSDGIPDVLNEVKFEIDWYQKMQAKDGAVFDRLTAQQWEQHPYDPQPKLLAPVSTHSTALYAAVLAQAYRVFKSNAAFESRYPGYADALLVKSKKAWNYLLSHPVSQPANGIDVRALGIGGGDYQDTAKSNCDDGETPGVNCPYSDVDGRAWAAAELYKATGDQAYHNAFKTYWPQTPSFFGTYNNFVYQNPLASLTYVTIKNYPTDTAITSKIKNDYRTLSDEQFNYTNNNTYRVGYQLNVPAYIGWGQFGHSASRAFNLIKAYVLLGDAKYLDAAKINFDVQLGANPQYRSYITGVGYATPRNPLHLTSVWLRQNRGATDPVPGIPVFGPHSYASESSPFVSAAQSDNNIYPSLHSGAYPILRRYFDLAGFVEQSEFGIGSLAPILAAFAYFSN